MAGAAIRPTLGDSKYDRSSEFFAKNRNKGKRPEKAKWRKSVPGNVCPDNPDVVIDGAKAFQETCARTTRTLL
jgi:hypothetical protein